MYEYTFENFDIETQMSSSFDLRGESFEPQNGDTSAEEELVGLEVIVIGERTEFHSSNFVVNSFVWQDVDYRNYYLHDILEMIDTGHAPGSPENPVDDLDEIVAVADKPNMKASEAFHWASDIMSTISKGYAGASMAFGIAAGVAAVDPVPGDEVVLGGLAIGTGAGAWMADAFADWADQKADYYEKLEQDRERPREVPAY